MGGMLIYGARNPAVRPLILTVAGTSEATFIGLVLSHGGRFLGYQVGIAVVVDLLWVVVFVSYLLAVRRAPMAKPTNRVPGRSSVTQAWAESTLVSRVERRFTDASGL